MPNLETHNARRTAARMRRDYFTRLDWLTRRTKTDTGTLKEDLRAHLNMLLRQDAGRLPPDEAMALALARLGDPERLIKPLAMDGLWQRAVRPARIPLPVPERRALLDGLGWSGLLLSLGLALGKLLAPHHTGLFLDSGGNFAFGIVAQPFGKEQLGLGLIPLAILPAMPIAWRLIRRRPA